MTSVPASAIAIVISFILLCWLTMKDWNLGLVVLICSLIVGCTTEAGPFGNLTDNFLTGAFSVMSTTFLPFVFAGVFAALMTASKSGEVIATKLFQWLGPNAAPYVIMITTIILCCAGMASAYVFIITPIAFSMLKKANLPRVIGFTAMASVAPIVLWCVPGLSVAGNFLPTGFLGTSMTAGAGMGLICAVLGIGACFVYVTILTKQARKAGVGYDPYEGEELDSQELSAGEMPENAPSFFAALLPVIVVVALSIILSVSDYSPAATVLVSQAAASVVCLLLNWKRIDNKVKVMGKGVSDVSFLVLICCLLGGYSYTVSATSAYEQLVVWISGLNANAYVITWVAIALFCGLTASTVNGPLLFYATLAPTLIANGANPAAIHRLSTVTATTFDSLPHAASVVSNITFFRLKFKDAYPKVFISTVLIPLVYSLVALAIAIIFY